MRFSVHTEVFVVFMGESVAHEWDEGKHKAHQNIWKAETDEGRRGVEQHTAQRKADQKIR